MLMEYKRTRGMFKGKKMYCKPFSQLVEQISVPIHVPRMRVKVV